MIIARQADHDGKKLFVIAFERTEIERLLTAELSLDLTKVGAAVQLVITAEEDEAALIRYFSPGIVDSTEIHDGRSGDEFFTTSGGTDD